MTVLKLTPCRIRKTRETDIDLILHWENDPALWPVTDDAGPFSREEIEIFVLRSRSLEHDKQERWILEDETGRSVGCIDLFDYEENEQSCGIGVVIPSPNDRRKGYALSGIRQLLSKVKKETSVHRLHCMIFPDNLASIRLFEKLGFQLTGKGLFKGKEVCIFEFILSA